MSVKKLFESFFRIIGDSEDYFITGSLSFLPLMAPYREPAHDIDVSLTKALFHARRHIISEEGKIRALRLPEVAVATDSIITRILAPKTDFFHVETDNGLLDISMYRSDNDSVEFKLGAGLTFAVPASLLERVQILSWEGFSYRAGPPEFAFLPKAVLYPKLKRSMAKLDEMGTKHLQDLKRLAQIIDWDFAAVFLDQLEIRWRKRPIPRVFDRRFNPFRKIDIDWLREELL